MTTLPGRWLHRVWQAYWHLYLHSVRLSLHTLEGGLLGVLVLAGFAAAGWFSTPPWAQETLLGGVLLGLPLGFFVPLGIRLWLAYATTAPKRLLALPLGGLLGALFLGSLMDVPEAAGFGGCVGLLLGLSHWARWRPRLRA